MDSSVDTTSEPAEFPSSIEELEDFRSSLCIRRNTAFDHESNNNMGGATEEVSEGTPLPTQGNSNKDLKELQSSLYQQDPRLGTEQVVHIIGEAIRAQKQAKMANRFLAIGLVATTLTSVATTTYLAVKQSNNVDTLQVNIQESSISDAVIVKLNENKEEEDEQGRIIIGFVALEDVEHSWRDAQKGLTVTSTLTVKDEDSNELLETVFTIDATNAELQVDVNGNKNYSNLSTLKGEAFEVQCDGSGASAIDSTGDGNKKCKVFVPSDGERYLGRAACVIL